jgi:hypothetical protein
MTAYLWLLKYIIPFVVGGVLGGYGVGLVKNGTIARQVTEIKEQKEIVATQNKTISTLKEWREKEAKTCQARLTSKDSVIKRLKVIDALTSENKNTGDDTNETVDTDSGDPILGELGRMFKPGSKD